MSSDIDPQEFGEMRAEIRTQRSLLDELRADMKAIRSQLSEAEGGWRTLVWLGGAAASVGAVVSWVVHEFYKR